MKRMSGSNPTDSNLFLTKKQCGTIKSNLLVVLELVFYWIIRDATIDQYGRVKSYIEKWAPYWFWVQVGRQLWNYEPQRTIFLIETGLLNNYQTGFAHYGILVSRLAWWNWKWMAHHAQGPVIWQHPNGQEEFDRPEGDNRTYTLVGYRTIHGNYDAWWPVPDDLNDTDPYEFLAEELTSTEEFSSDSSEN